MIAGAFAAVKVGQFVTDAVEVYSEFEQSMANTAATANATRAEYELPRLGLLFRILSFCCLPYSTTSFAMSMKSDSASPKKAMANTAATANATRAEYEQLEAAAREMGKATTKTAAEASDALGYMMLAGR